MLDTRKTLPGLRQALGLQPWRGHSDTETLLAVIERWGIDEALRQTVGMFAIALWDNDTRTLTLARDRLGEKPLYVASLPGGMAFASELKALLDLPGLDLTIDEQAVGHFLQRGCVPAPWTIHRGVRKLLPGHLLRLVAPTDTGPAQAWWSLPQDMGKGTPSDDTQALAEFERLLLQSLQGQRLADVPLGAFLSGGVDSSLVTALLQTIRIRPTTNPARPGPSPGTWAPTTPNCRSTPAMLWPWCPRWWTFGTNPLPMRRRFPRCCWRS